jgi:preprotein translocase subunit SecF
MGGDVLHKFEMALVVGNFLGSYSSIAVAAPLVYEWERRRKGVVTAVAASKPSANGQSKSAIGKTAGVRRG